MLTVIGLWGFAVAMLALIVETVLRMIGWFPEAASKWLRYTCIGGAMFFVMLSWEFLWPALRAIAADKPAVLITIVMLLSAALVARLTRAENKH